MELVVEAVEAAALLPDHDDPPWEQPTRIATNATATVSLLTRGPREQLAALS
ncbi:MAG TPA: hypothetical protein VFF73_01445 [Planctomycetota bacterium]|nr:hypothetical protein [Planctomycetota bacterium]